MYVCARALARARVCHCLSHCLSFQERRRRTLARYDGKLEAVDKAKRAAVYELHRQLSAAALTSNVSGTPLNSVFPTGPSDQVLARLRAMPKQSRD